MQPFLLGQQMKISIPLSLGFVAQASIEKDPIERALSWLSTYLQQSADMQNRYKATKFVLPTLEPLMGLVPYVPQDRPLFRVIGFETTPRKNIVLPANFAHSCTYGVGEKFWRNLADEIGASSASYVLVVSVEEVVHELFNTSWIQKKLVPWVKKNRPHSAHLDDLEEWGTDWQKEVVVFSSTPVKCKLVSDIS